MSNTVVRTNILAMNSHRNLGLVSNQQARASRNLSSGFRINSAADDAAGLAISEGMRAQIRGMAQASRNTQDGISLIQTSEGYMQTITELAQRMRELSIQGANDTNNAEQRAFIAAEMAQMQSEIERIWATATFNGQEIFAGEVAGGGLAIASTATDETVAAQENAARQAAASAVRNAALTLQGGLMGQTGNVEALREFSNAIATLLGPGGGFQGDPDADIDDAFDLAIGAIGGMANAAAVTTAANALFAATADGQLTALNTAIGALNTANGVTSTDEGYVAQIDLTELTAALAAGTLDGSTDLGDVAGYISDALDRLDEINAAIAGFATAGAGAAGSSEGILRGDFYLQVGPDGAVDTGFGHSLRVSGTDGQLGYVVEDVASGIDRIRGHLGGIEQMFMDGSVDGGSNLYDHATFSGFVTDLDVFIGEVNALRAGLGAIQNRLEFTIENLDIARENLSAAESRIRDADMALEMMRLTQANVLQQAATAMLAQGNQAPQNVLQLLG